jgi:ParB family chromosome partitioning protein
MALDLQALDAAAAAMAEVRQAPVPVQVAPTAPPAAFVEDPAQPRSEFVEDEKYMALVASIRLRGLLQPLIVQRLPAGLLQIRFGARRFRAAIAAGLMEIPYLEAHDERQLDDYAQVEENQERLDLQPLDLAQFIQRKLAAGEKKKDIAARLHIDPSAVTHLLALAFEPPPLLLELYHSQRCRAPHLLYALRNLLKRHGPVLEQELAGDQVIDRHRVETLAAMLTARSGSAENKGTNGTREESAGVVAPGSRSRPVAEGGGASTGRPGSGLRGKIPADAGSECTPCNEARLLGHHHGAALELLLNRTPQGDGWIWIRYLDGERTAQVPIGEIVLTRLHIGDGPGHAAEKPPSVGRRID